MIRKFAYNKIFRTTGMLLLFLLLLLFPASKEYSLDDNVTIKTATNIKEKEVYLIDKNNYVARTKVSLNANSDEDYARKLVELLITDGKYQESIPNGFKGILPSTTIINSIEIDGDVIKLDVSDDFYAIKKPYDEVALEAITYNLTTIDGIKSVLFSVNNEVINYLPSSNKYILQPLTRKDGINKELDIKDYKNSTLTTIYYISKNNNKDYYVPVTKITNDNRGKIEIIIDELTSSSIYETNLMSFLNYNTKLQSYSISNDVITVDFNNYIFDNVDDKSILEEVVYSISLSIRDNYNVKEVIFTVNGAEIAKSVLKNIE